MKLLHLTFAEDLNDRPPPDKKSKDPVVGWLIPDELDRLYELYGEDAVLATDSGIAKFRDSCLPVFARAGYKFVSWQHIQWQEDFGVFVATDPNNFVFAYVTVRTLPIYK